MRIAIRKERWKEFWERSNNYEPTDSEFQHKQLLQTQPSIELTCDQTNWFSISASGFPLKNLP